MKKRSYQTCDLMHGNICVSKPCICKGMSISQKRKKSNYKGRKPGSKNKVKKAEPTKVKRIPIAIEDVIDEIIRVHKERLREINS